MTGHAHAVTAVEMCLAAGLDGTEHCSCLTAEGIAMPERLADALAASGIAVYPTLSHAPGVQPPPRVQGLLDRLGLTVEDHRAQVAALHRAGVRLIGGTDSGVSRGQPHGSMRQSVIDMVETGIPVTQALAAATGEAARACGLHGPTGRLAAGLDADLLVVDDDPLTDITALRDVRLVVSWGREVVLAGASVDARP